MLVREGLAKVDEYSNAKELWTAQEEAQAARRNVRPSPSSLASLLAVQPVLTLEHVLQIWSSFDPAAAAAAANGADSSAAGASTPAPKRTEYLDVVVSEVRGGTETVPFSFSVQVLEDGGIPALEKLMGDLTIFHQDDAQAPVPGNFVPRSGDLVSAKFSVDNAWYRAKVRRSNPAKKEAEVVYIDCASPLASSPASSRTS